jgi:hypothetical protein
MASRRPLTALLVVSGLLACSVTATFSADPREPLPGVALNSPAILVVERTIALFAAWMLVLVVVARGLAGELPLEVTSRGFRYAEADKTRRTTAELQRTIEALEADLSSVRRAALEGRRSAR